MSRRIAIGLIACLILTLPATAWAQYGKNVTRSQSYLNRRPPVSPYLNLFQGGGTANNYYNLVRPQIQQSRTNQQFRGEFNTLDREVGQFDSQSIPATGHQTHFGNMSHYYGGGSGAPSGGMGGGRRGPTTIGSGMNQGGSRNMVTRAGGGNAAMRTGAGVMRSGS